MSAVGLYHVSCKVNKGNVSCLVNKRNVSCTCEENANIMTNANFFKQSFKVQCERNKSAVSSHVTYVICS